MRATLLTHLTVFGFAAGVHAGAIHTVVGGGSSYGDGGPATAAQLSTPQGLAFDLAGNLYIADASAFVVRRVDATTGVITTVAGDGNFGNQGDGGPATLASLSTPFGIAADLYGDLLIADQLNLVIRKVDLGTGIITTIAGTGGFGHTGDLGPAILATFSFPEGVAVDAIGDVYIADTTNAALRKITRATGIIETVAGGTILGTSTGDGGPAIAATFVSVRRVAVDLAGNLFIADSSASSRVRRIDAATTIIQTVAGGGTGTGESGPALDANLGDARDVAVDSAGNLYVAGPFRVWKIDPAGDISVLAGIGVSGFGGDGGPAPLAEFGDIGGVAAGSDGGLYISDFGNARVRKVDADVVVPALGLPASLLAFALLAFVALVPLTRLARATSPSRAEP